MLLAQPTVVVNNSVSGWTVVAAIGTLLAAIVTAWMAVETRRVADRTKEEMAATKESAKATKDSASATNLSAAATQMAASAAVDTVTEIRTDRSLAWRPWMELSCDRPVPVLDTARAEFQMQKWIVRNLGSGPALGVTFLVRLEQEGQFLQMTPKSYPAQSLPDYARTSVVNDELDVLFPPGPLVLACVFCRDVFDACYRFSITRSAITSLVSLTPEVLPLTSTEPWVVSYRQRTI